MKNGGFLSCLDAVYSQNYRSFEVIVVDNESTDKTIEKVRQYPVKKKIVTITDYLPCKSLNLGIEQSKGEYIVCLSAHCIPTKYLVSISSKFIRRR